jgi:hypothetical protein
MFPEYFSEVPGTDGAPRPGHRPERLNHKLVARLRSWFHRGSFKNKMTLKDLFKWKDIRNGSDCTSLGANAWKMFQNPESPEKMFAMLDNWPGIKAEIDAHSRPYIFESETQLQNAVDHWGKDALKTPSLNHYGCVDLADQNDCLNLVNSFKSKIQQWRDGGYGNYFERREDHMLPTLVALFELGLRDNLTEFIRDTRDDDQYGRISLQHCTQKYPEWAFSIQKHYPELVQALNFPPSHWAELRKLDHDNFNRAQVLLAQTRLWNNSIDDFNAPWLVDPDIA